MCDELRSLASLLQMVLDRVEAMEGPANGTDATLEPPSFASVAAPDGPVQRFKTVLEVIVAKVVPKGTLGRLAQPLKWPFDKIREDQNSPHPGSAKRSRVSLLPRLS